MKSSTLRDATLTPPGVPLDLPTEQVTGSAVIEISYSLTSASQRRIPPCGRGLSSSSWCEVEIVQGVWTCLACNSIAPGKITVPSS